MENNKLRRVLAIVALVFMAIFTVTFVITLVSPKLYHGAFSYAALVSGLLGIGLFLVIRFALKEKTPPEYLPEDENGARARGKESDGEEDPMPSAPATQQDDAARSSDTDKD